MASASEKPNPLCFLPNILGYEAIMSSSHTLPADSWSSSVKNWEVGLKRELSQASQAMCDLSGSSPSAAITLQSMRQVLDDTKEASDDTIQGLYAASQQTHPDYLVDRFTHLDKCLERLKVQLRDDTRTLGQGQEGLILTQLASLVKATAGTTVGWECVREDLEMREERGQKDTLSSLGQQLETALKRWQDLDPYVQIDSDTNTRKRSLTEDGKWHALNVDQHLSQLHKRRSEGQYSSLVLSRKTVESIEAYIDITRRLDKVLTPELAEMIKWRKIRKAHSSMASGTTGSSRRSGEQARPSRDRIVRYRLDDYRERETRETYRFETIFKVATDLATINRSARCLAVFAVELKVPVPKSCQSAKGGKKVRSRLRVSFVGIISDDEDEAHGEYEARSQDRQTSKKHTLKHASYNEPMNIPQRPGIAKTPTTLAELLQRDEPLDCGSSDNDSTIADFHNSELVGSFAHPQGGRQTTSTGPDTLSRVTSTDHPPALPPRKRFRASSPLRRYKEGSDERTVYLESPTQRSSTRHLSLAPGQNDQDEGLLYGEYRGDEWIPHRSLMMWLTSYTAVNLVRKAGDILEKRGQAKEALSTRLEESKSALSKTRGSAQSVVGEYTRARHDGVV